MTGFWLVSYIALWILFLVLALVLISVLRNLGTIYETLAAQPHMREEPIKLVAGEAVPELALTTLAGEQVPLSQFRGKKTAFFVVSPGCAPCISLLKEIAQNGSASYPHDSTIRQRVIVSVADAAATAELVAQVGLRESVAVLIDAESGTRERWGINGTPTTVILDDQLNFVEHRVGFETAPIRELESAVGA